MGAGSYFQGLHYRDVCFDDVDEFSAAETKSVQSPFHHGMYFGFGSALKPCLTLRDYVSGVCTENAFNGLSAK